MNIQQKLEIYKEIQEKAQKLCQRWANYQGYGGYAALSKIDFDTQQIYFIIHPCSSGIGERCSISITYLEDSATLDIDAVQYFRNKNEESANRSKRIADLKSLPEVQEYQELTSTSFPHMTIGYKY